MTPKDNHLSGSEIENTPLELYDTAYRLQYVDNRISEALKYYEILINEFPDSNECGYAAVQIQKIKASDLAGELKVTPATLHPVATISLILNILILLGVGGGGYFLYQKNESTHAHTKSLLDAYSKIYADEYDDALKILAELKIASKNDITPFELSAYIYRQKDLFEQAASEYEVFFRLNPNRQPTENEKQNMELSVTPKSYSDELKAIKPEQKRQDYSSTTQPVAREIRPAQLNSRTTKNKNISNDIPKKAAPAQKQKKIKSLFLVDPDSISYF